MTWKQWFLMGAAVVMGSAWAATPSVVVVEPLCKATEAWNQTGNLNAYVDLGMNYPCGCDMLAWGQIATYHGLVTGYPAKGWKPTPTTGEVTLWQGNTQLINKEIRTTLPGEYNWTDIRDQGKGVSRLMRDLGVLGKTAYRPGATSGTLGNVGFAKYFDYAGSGYKMSLPYSGNGALPFPQVIIPSIRGSLQAGAPVAVAIICANGGAHAIVCDGLGYAEDGKELYHFHYGWGSGSGCWYDASFFYTSDKAGVDKFEAAYFNVHPQDLGCVLAGRVTRAGKAVANAQVTLSTKQQSVMTDAAGAYCFTGLAPETSYSVTVTVDTESVTQSFTTGEFVDDDLRVERQAAWDNAHKDGTHIPLETGNVILDFTLSVPTTYITPDGTGDGSSWEKAAALTNATLQSAGSGQTVCVASGNYTVKEIITVPAGVTLMGGYNPTTGVRNVYGSPSKITMGTASHGYPPSYIFQINSTAIVDGFVLENNPGDSGYTINGGTVKNCIFTGSYAKIAEKATLQCCIVRNPSATQDECSLIHCTFAGEIPTGKENKGIVAGCLAKAAADFPASTLIGTCTCGQCPETALNGRALDKTPGALATPAPGFTLNVR